MNARKKVVISAKRKLQAIERYQAGEKPGRLGAEFGVTSGTIMRWRRCEERIREDASGVRGDGWEDVGDERHVPIREEYELALYIGTTPDQFRDEEFVEKYAKWLGKHTEAKLLARALALGLTPEAIEAKEIAKRFAPWLRAAGAP